MRRSLIGLLLAGMAALPAAGQGIASATISGSSVKVTISLPLGLGADASLSFENVVGLSVANLGLSARLVNPLDPLFLARFPAGVTPALPILLRIEPPASGGLSFSGIVTLELHTHDLLYVLGCPLRLYAAPLGGPFRDITAGMGAGSYRARGTSGGFSEFLIVTDGRSLTGAIADKLDHLEGILALHAGLLPAALHDDLESQLATVRAEWEDDDPAGAIVALDAFLANVTLHSGAEIPDVWRSARDLVNVAGLLRASGLTLRLSLGLASGGL